MWSGVAPSTLRHDTPWGRVPARALGALMVAGAGLGALNLSVHGVLRPGTPRDVYAATMVGLALVGIYILTRSRVTNRVIAALVAAGNIVYVVIALTVTDANLYAGPLMLLFALTAAACFLGLRSFVIQLLVVPPICWAGLANSDLVGSALAIQVLVQSGVLILASVLVYTLRVRSERLLRQTERLSSTDPLTGLANRRAMEMEAERLWDEVAADNALLAAFVLDMDNFKALNDGYGHAVGDEVLRLVATAVRGAAGPGSVVARTGGEEMVVLCRLESSADVLDVGERLRRAVADGQLPRPMTASIGAATARSPDGDAPVEGVWRLVDAADMAMYEAKRSGGNRVATAAELDLMS